MRVYRQCFRITAAALLLTHLVGALLLSNVTLPFQLIPVQAHQPFWWRVTFISWLLADGLTILFLYLIYARFPDIPRPWRYIIAVSAGLAILVDGWINLEVLLTGYNWIAPLAIGIISLGIANGLFALAYSLLTWILWRQRLVPRTLTIVGMITWLAAFGIVPIGWQLLSNTLLLPLGTIFTAGWCLWILIWLRVY